MARYRMRQLLDVVTDLLPKWMFDDQREARKKLRARLAVEIFEHGKLLYQYSSRPIFLLESELAFHLRETPYGVLAALRLLAQEGWVEQTNFPGYWALRLQSSTNNSGVNNCHGTNSEPAPNYSGNRPKPQKAEKNVSGPCI